MAALDVEDEIRNLNKRTAVLEQNLQHVLTKEDLTAVVAKLATKVELREAVATLATKVELREAVATLATKIELREAVAKLATKEDVEASKEYTRTLIRVTRGEIRQVRNEMATKAELQELRREMEKGFGRLTAQIAQLHAPRRTRKKPT